MTLQDIQTSSQFNCRQHGVHVLQVERQEAEKKAVLLEEQVSELKKEAANAAADSAAALEAVAQSNLQEIAALKVRLWLLTGDAWPSMGIAAQFEITNSEL